MTAHTSFSSMRLYDECPAQWKAKRIDKVVEPPSAPLESGILLHEIIKTYLEELYSSGLTEYAAGMPAIVERVFTHGDRVTSTRHYDDVMIAAKGFAKYYRLRVDQLVGLEIKITMPLGDNYPELLGYIDIAEQEADKDGRFIGITDFKTGWGSTVLDSHKFQRKLYGLMMRHHYPSERIGVRNHYTRANVVTEYEIMQPWDYDSVLGQAKAILQRMERAEVTKVYPATPNENCGWCPIAGKCAVLQGLVKTGNAIDSQADAEAITREILVIDAARSAKLKALKTWVNGAGPVILENGARAAYTTPSPSPTVTDIAALVAALGDEAYPLLRADARALKKFVDDSRLDAIWTESTPRPIFKVGKGKDDDDDD
jgi:hypothetical protein